jgi:hypothetical protein
MALPLEISLPLLGAAALLTGCGGAPSLPALQLPPQSTTLQIGTTEAYTRIAQAAMSCWFGPRGRLTNSYVFHADANPPSRGGAAEIVIHERAFDQPKPLGYKAFRIALTKGSDFTNIEIENLRMPEPLAEPMRAEVLAWARGSKGCMGDKVANPGAGLPSTPVTSSGPAPRN